MADKRCDRFQVIDPDTRCWNCKCKLDGFTDVFGLNTPLVGDFTLCIECHQPSVFISATRGLGLRKPTEDENRRLAANVKASLLKKVLDEIDMN